LDWQRTYKIDAEGNQVKFLKDVSLFAEIAYDLLDKEVMNEKTSWRKNGNCNVPLPPGYRCVGLLTGVAEGTAEGEGFFLFFIIYLLFSFFFLFAENMGFVALWKSYDRVNVLNEPLVNGRTRRTEDFIRYKLVVAFRGTVTKTDWKHNLFAWKNSESSCPEGKAKVHAGFDKVLKSIKIKRSPTSSELFLPGMKRLARDMTEYGRGPEEHRKLELIDRDVTILGHSLGGALSTLASVRLAKEKIFKAEELSVVTYGAPRVGNEGFVECFDKLKFRRQPIRVVAPMDIVPKVPPTWIGYKHIAGKFEPEIYRKMDLTEDVDGLQCAHSMLSYYDVLVSDPKDYQNIKENMLCNPAEKWVKAKMRKSFTGSMMPETMYLEDYKKK
jgi:hypothetical protein